MAENTATVGAEVQTEVDPFKGFVSESYNDPTPIEIPKAAVADATGDSGVTEEEVESALEGVDRSGDPDKKNKTPAKDRIAELLAARREALNEAADLRARLAALEKPVEVKPAEPEKKAEEKKGPPSPADFEFGELDSRYIDARIQYGIEQGLTAWETKQQLRQEEATAKTKAQEARSKFEQQTKIGASKYQDYYEKVIEGAEKGDWPLSQPLGELLVQSEVAHDIAYHLATHPEEAVKIYQSSPLEQARTFGRLEAQFSAAQPAATAKAAEVAEPITPRAPAPVTPSRGAGGRFQPAAENEDFSSFERRMRDEGLL